MLLAYTAGAEDLCVYINLYFKWKCKFVFFKHLQQVQYIAYNKDPLKALLTLQQININ